MEFNPKIGISTALIRSGGNMLSVVDEFRKKGIQAFELCPNSNPITQPDIRNLARLVKDEGLLPVVHEASTYKITGDEQKDFETHWRDNEQSYLLAERVGAFYVVKHPFIKHNDQPVSPDLVSSVFDKLRERSGGMLNSIETGVYRRVSASDNVLPYEIEDARTPKEAQKYLACTNVVGLTGDTGKMARFLEKYEIGGKELTSIFTYLGECRYNRIPINGVQLVGSNKWPEASLAAILTLQGLLAFGYGSTLLFIDSHPELFDDMFQTVSQKLKEMNCKEKKSLFASEPLDTEQTLLIADNYYYIHT